MLIAREWLRRFPRDRRVELTAAGRREVAALFPGSLIEHSKVEQ
jgi:hypothetical protein